MFGWIFGFIKWSFFVLIGALVVGFIGGIIFGEGGFVIGIIVGLIIGHAQYARSVTPDLKYGRDWKTKREFQQAMRNSKK